VSITVLEFFDAEWNGVKVHIAYEPEWLGNDDTAHLTITSVDPERVPLPITETGYLSHFTSREIVESYGGPVALVLTWLEEESRSPVWIAKDFSRRQLSLF